MQRAPCEEAREEERDGSPDGCSLISAGDVVDEPNQWREDPHGEVEMPKEPHIPTRT